MTTMMSDVGRVDSDETDSPAATTVDAEPPCSASKSKKINKQSVTPLTFSDWHFDHRSILNYPFPSTMRKSYAFFLQLISCFATPVNLFSNLKTATEGTAKPSSHLASFDRSGTGFHATAMKQDPLICSALTKWTKPLSLPL